MTTLRKAALTVLFAVLVLAVVRAEDKKPAVSEKQFRRARALLLEDPLADESRELARAILIFTMETPAAAVVLGQEELQWTIKDEKRGLLLLAAYLAGNVESQLNSGVKRNDRYAGLLALFRVYRALQEKDKEFKIAAVDELLKLHRQDELVKHLQQLEEKKPTRLTPEEEEAIRKLREGNSAGDGPYKDLADREPVILPEFTPKMRFGLVLPREKDPANPGKFKRLTYEEDGTTNNTVVRLDGIEHLFGQAPGKWLKKDRTDIPLADVLKAKQRYRWSGTWEYVEDIRVTQTVEIVPNQQTRKLDTCLVRYTVVNHSALPRKVGIRTMLDTFIGANDGVPFRIPGQKDFVETKKVLSRKEIPEHIEAWEYADLKRPGTIAHLGLKPDMPEVNLDPLTQVVICRFPGNSEIRDWEWDFKAINDPPEERKDSCVVLYWGEQILRPREKREMAYTYGLNAIVGGAQLALSASGSFRPGGTFTLTATVDNAAGEPVRLELPSGVSIVEGQAEQRIDKAEGPAQRTWGLRADKVGTYPLTVTSGEAKAVYNVKISNKSIFD
jgi:hypothetical protein